MVEVHQDQVGHIAGGNDARLAAQSFCAAHGGHAKHIHGQKGQRVMADTGVDGGGELHLLEHIVAVVGGHAVGADGHVDPSLQHGGDGGHTGAQLQVGHRVVDAGDPLLCHDGPILFGGPDTVGGNGTVLPHAVLVQDLDGGLAPMAAFAGLMLKGGLGHVDVHAQALFLGVVGHPLPQGGVGGVLTVDGSVHQDLAVAGVVPQVGELLLVIAVVAGGGAEVGRAAEVHAAAGQVGADAGLQDLLGDGAGEHIHVADAGDAGGDHLGQAQTAAGSHSPLVQLGLGREDPLVQPGLQVTAAAVAPQEGHGHVGVSVHQTGHQDVALAVDLLVEVPLGPVGAHRGDGLSFHSHIGVVQEGACLVHEKGAAVIE